LWNHASLNRMHRISHVLSLQNTSCAREQTSASLQVTKACQVKKQQSSWVTW
jgi:hypothetical protein